MGWPWQYDPKSDNKEDLIVSDEPTPSGYSIGARVTPRNHPTSDEEGWSANVGGNAIGWYSDVNDAISGAEDAVLNDLDQEIGRLELEAAAMRAIRARLTQEDTESEADEEPLNTYMVIGLYLDQAEPQRFAHSLEANHPDEAETRILEEFDPEGDKELTIAGTVEGEVLVA
jgi:hypothetical protein